MNYLKKHFTTILLVIIMVIGFSLLLYPAFSNWWNSFHQTRAIASYEETVTQLDHTKYEEIRRQAQEYNRQLLEKKDRWNFSEEEKKEYEKLLNPDETGIMGYVEIPEIRVSLPIYHGTDEGVLQIAVGHIEGSSLPVGGEGTHSVLSGHSGLPSAKLLTDLEKLKTGSVFYLKILDEVLAYETDQIKVVEPYDFSQLEIEPGKDFCTLVTCTPYGINSHRLLVRGHRIACPEETAAEAAVAKVYNPVVVFSAIAGVILLLALIFVLIRKYKVRGGRQKE